MARKKNMRTRRQEFKAQQRNSWLNFLAKVTLFAVPVIGLTIWLILWLLYSGRPLPILYLDYAQPLEQLEHKRTWNRINYSTTKDSGIQLPKNLVFGGPNKDTLVIFNDLLGSERPFGDEFPLVACVFEPSTPEEHSTNGFRGLTLSETGSEAKQKWIRFEDYVQKHLDEIKKSTEWDKGRKKIVMVLDVDHPDLPGHLPPQSNSFIELCHQQWTKEKDKLNQDFDVFVWLSHSEGQMSYYDSDPRKVESFFKQRFDKAISGDVIHHQGDDNKGRVKSKDIHYSDLKDYLEKWVESDSNVHKLAQTPHFLEPTDWVDFPILRFAQTPPADLSLFEYSPRESDKLNKLKTLWEDFGDARKSDDWNLENPLYVQRSLLLLLQLEKLWYVGKSDSTLFGDLEDEFKYLIDNKTTIDPIRHTLYDEMRQETLRTKKTPAITPLKMEWLVEIPREPAEPQDPTKVDPENKKTSEELEAEQEAALVRWGKDSPGWTGSMGVWQTFRDNQASKQEIKKALSHLSDEQQLVQRNESDRDIEDLSELHWNEIAFLHRLADELSWPGSHNELADFKELIRKSIMARDAANQFQAELTPLLCLKFNTDFERLENQRRAYEDRVFANDHSELVSDFSILIEQYRDLAEKNFRLKKEFEKIQSQLISAPHDYRYCLESLAVQSQNGGDEASRKSVVQKFDEWVNSETGFIKGWNRLKDQDIGALPNFDDNEATTSFEKVREGGFPDQGSNTTQSRGFASNPYIDSKRFHDEKLDVESADGNLLARRLLFWPGLDLVSRTSIRNDLSSKSANPSGRDEVVDIHPTTYALGNETRQWMETPIESITYEKRRNEDFFITVAANAHRLLVKSSDKTTKNVELAINDFRSEKSNLDFLRVANDLWGSPKSTIGTPFVKAALVNHQNVIDSRIQKLPDGLRDNISPFWNSGPKAKWPKRTEEVKSFCENFPRWQWLRDAQRAQNNSLAGSIASERQRDNTMLFALSPREYPYNELVKGEFDNEKNWLIHTPVPGDTLRVYLRGHQKTFDMTQRPPDPKSIYFDVALDTKNSKGAKLVVKKVNDGPVAGHITLVIDCSQSMTNAGMNRAKDDVLEFLDQLGDRADISVSLIAIGAGEIYDVDGETWLKRNPKELPSWKKDESHDVWVFEGSSKVVDKNTLPGLKIAISELKMFGETPILAGLKKALKISRGKGSKANVIVLLTDGFEFGNDPELKLDFLPFNRTRYDDIRQKIKQEKAAELVVFSFEARIPKAMVEAMTKPEIDDRIKSIEKLATINRKVSNTTLKQFFDGLLPQPIVFARGNGEPRLNKKARIENGIDRRGKMAEIVLKPEQHPDDWSVGVQFDRTEINNAADSFAQVPLDWHSTTRINGNEYLEFNYEPFSPSFGLTTARIRDPSAREMELEEQRLLVGKTSQRTRKPEFEIAAKTENELTPAPAIAFLTINRNGDPKRAVLMQDFNLLQQNKSNVRHLEFGVFTKNHRLAMFPNGNTDLKLQLIRDLTPEFWAKVHVDGQDPWTVINDGEKKLEIEPNDYASLDELLPSTPDFIGYKFEILRNNTGIEDDYADFWIRVTSNDQKKKPIDRWLIQILGSDGRVNRRINNSTQRRYGFLEHPDESKQLIHVEHRFKIIKRELKNSKAYFGFANIDHIEEIEIGELTYPNYFEGE